MQQSVESLRTKPAVGDTQLIPSAESHGRQLAVTLLTRLKRAGFREALRGFSVLHVDLNQELVTAVRSEPVALVVVEPWDKLGLPVAPAVRLLKAAYPSVPIIAYCEHDAATHHEMIPLARAGIDSLVLRGIDDAPGAIRSVGFLASVRCAQQQIMTTVRVMVRSDIATFIDHCLRHATDADAVTVGAAARALGLDRKTLLNRLLQQQMPVPREILAWCRMLVAARLLEDSGRSIEQVGFAIGCGSGTGLRSLFVRHTGLRPAQVREAGGLRYLLPRFVTFLERPQTTDSGR